MSTTLSEQVALDDAVHRLTNTPGARGNRIGWLMLSTLLAEAWAFYSITVVLRFIREELQPAPVLLIIGTVAVQAGAIIGALLGGFLSDRFGRRIMFRVNMILFIAGALGEAFAPNAVSLVVMRFLIGLPMGSNVCVVNTVIMEALPAGRRERMANRWGFTFALGQLLTFVLTSVLVTRDLPHDLIWRLTLGLGALPALVVLLLGWRLPESAVWLIRRGRLREARRVAALDTLPDRDVPVGKQSLADLFRDPVRRRATLYGWIACFFLGAEFAALPFYLPLVFYFAGWRSIQAISLASVALYLTAVIAGWTAPLMTSRYGQRGVAMAGFAIVLVSLVVAAGAFNTEDTGVLPFVTATLLFGHCWGVANFMTIPTLVADPAYRATAAGIASVFIRVPALLALFVFQPLFTLLGVINSTLFVAVFPLIGLLAATFLLPEVYRFGQQENSASL